MEMHIAYRRYRFGDDALLAQIVTCYQSVFADPPWNEWKRCSVCNRQWGRTEWNAWLEANESPMHCGLPVSEFWPAAQVRQDIEHELTPRASCWLALDDGKVIGFCWGYPIALEDLERKLGTSISLRFLWKCGHSPSSEVAYQDELGVLLPYRDHGVARQLVTLRQVDFARKQLSLNVVRTREDPPSVTYLWYTREGYREIGWYDDGRVVLAKSEDGPLIPDPEH